MAQYYYDRFIKRVLPRNADVNIIIGARGLGKTYAVRKYMIDDYLKNGYCFCEVTRYREENNDVASTYFDRIINDNLYPNYIFKTTNKVAYIADKPKTDPETGKEDKPKWRVIGYFVPLSLQQQKKKNTFVRVRNICMDEIIIDTDDKYHRYLRNEYNQLAKLVDTVTRERADDTSMRKPRLYLLGNACDAFNPYFEHYKIPLNPSYGLQWLDGKTALFDYVQDAEYAREKTAKTVAGRMLKGDDAMTSRNEFKQYTEEFIEKPHQHAKLVYVLRWLKHDYGVYLDYTCGYVYISTSFNRAINTHYIALTRDDNKLNYLTANNAKEFVRSLIEYYSLSYLRYDSVATQKHIVDMLSNFGVK